MPEVFSSSSQSPIVPPPDQTARGDAEPRTTVRSFGFRLIGRTVFWVALAWSPSSSSSASSRPITCSGTLGSFQNIALDAAEVVPLAAVLALLLGAGELDISVGANIILSSVLAGKVMIALSQPTENQLIKGEFPNLTVSLTLGLLTAIATGMTVGLVNGLVVTKLGVNSFIATLAMLGIATGIADIVSNDSDLANIPTPLQTHFGVASLGGILPYPALTG